MAGRQRCAPQFQGLAIQGLSLGVAASGVEQQGEIVQAQRDVRKVRWQRCALHIQCLAPEVLCFAVITPIVQFSTKRSERLC